MAPMFDLWIVCGLGRTRYYCRHGTTGVEGPAACRVWTTPSILYPVTVLPSTDQKSQPRKQ